jgi:MFS superfamily sulfate permease-like transporter
VLTNQEIKWAVLLVVVVSFARVQLRKRWPDQMRRWEHPIDLLILVTVIFLMMAALTNLGREPGRPMPAGPTRIASVTLTAISLEKHI